MELHEESCWIGTPPHDRVFFLSILRPPRCTLFPYTTLFRSHRAGGLAAGDPECRRYPTALVFGLDRDGIAARSEEHTSELQSHVNLVCRLLLEKKKKSRVKELGLSIVNQLTTLLRTTITIKR